jgi:hypothetical protein
MFIVIVPGHWLLRISVFLECINKKINISNIIKLISILAFENFCVSGGAVTRHELPAVRGCALCAMYLYRV